MQDTEIYIKTDAGREEIRSRTLGLSMSVRAILLMVDGQRTVLAMRSLIAGSRAPADVLDALFAQGLIEPRSASAPAAPPPAVARPIEPRNDRPVVAPPVVVPIIDEPAPQVVAVTPPIASYDEPLDLVLATIYGPDAVEDEPPAAASVAPLPVPPAVAGPPPLDRYEHLYTMMNEVVRDFLAPHRRYFLQLKIERCGTPEELLELLHDLQMALAKSRGEAFASDVIARLRSAAA